MDRAGKSYGPVEESFDGIATVLSVVLRKKLKVPLGWAGRGVDDDVASFAGRQMNIHGTTLWIWRVTRLLSQLVSVKGGE
jgi:hypothetical protein